MTATAEAQPTETTEGEGRPLEALLLAALATRREQGEESGIDHPLLLAMLMRRRRGGEESGIEHPLLLAMLMRRRGEGE
ncbi:hypothetical protein AB0B45_43670, partial [Nonomuraea sp. NPDC049152]|uniref:hypothetical protein n=1 Tax=Nonomuraea sp. NPDC049152 TaxID=3154350 RepID=UPI0033CF9944